MSIAFQCDRCSRFQEGKPVAAVTFKRGTGTGSSHTLDEHADLCDQCQLQLVDWRDLYANSPKPTFGSRAVGK